jgi:hypothetical protein
MQFKPSNLEPIAFNIGGAEYPARLPFRALAELEELSKMGFLTFFDRFTTGNFTSTDLLNILYVSLKHGGVEVTFEDLQDMDITQSVLNDVMTEIARLLNRTQKVVSQLQDHKKPDEKKTTPK